MLRSRFESDMWEDFGEEIEMEEFEMEMTEEGLIEADELSSLIGSAGELFEFPFNFRCCRCCR